MLNQQISFLISLYGKLCPSNVILSYPHILKRQQVPLPSYPRYSQGVSPKKLRELERYIGIVMRHGKNQVSTNPKNHIFNANPSIFRFRILTHNTSKYILSMFFVLGNIWWKVCDIFWAKAPSTLSRACHPFGLEPNVREINYGDFLAPFLQHKRHGCNGLQPWFLRDPQPRSV